MECYPSQMQLTPHNAQSTEERVTTRDSALARQHGKRSRLSGAVHSNQTETLSSWYAH